MVSRLQVVVDPSSSPRPVGFLRPLAGVIGGTLAVGILAAALYIVSPSLMPETLALFAAAGMGLASGLLARTRLRGRSRLLRLSAAFGALAAAMAALGWLTWGLAGIRLVADRPPDWGGLGLLALGLAVSWLALTAWGGSEGVRVGQTASPGPRQPTRRWFPAATGDGWLARRRSSVVRLPAPLTRPARATRARRKRRAAVRLVGSVEHRCPYCLEIVERHDRRGVVICPECRTRHHADCWAVTGTCQVPHPHRQTGVIHG
jgi:hypothetical protein